MLSRLSACCPVSLRARKPTLRASFNFLGVRPSFKDHALSARRSGMTHQERSERSSTKLFPPPQMTCIFNAHGHGSEKQIQCPRRMTWASFSKISEHSDDADAKALSSESFRELQRAAVDDIEKQMQSFNFPKIFLSLCKPSQNSHLS